MTTQAVCGLVSGSHNTWSIVHRHSGARTNLKGEVGGGGHRPGRSARNCFFLSCPSDFLALQVQLVVLVSAFVTVSTVWSVSCLLFFYSRCPPCPVICTSGGSALWSRRHCTGKIYLQV